MQTLAARNLADIVSILKVDLSIKVYLKVYLYLKFAALKANKADTTKTSLCKLNSALVHLILLKSSTGKD